MLNLNGIINLCSIVVVVYIFQISNKFQVNVIRLLVQIDLYLYLKVKLF